MAQNDLPHNIQAAITALGPLAKALRNNAEQKRREAVVSEQEVADRLLGVIARLKASMGEDHPRVKDLVSQQKASAAVAAALKTSVARAERQPRPDPTAIGLSGRVLNPDHKALPSLHVEVLGHTPAEATTVTDEFGDFRFMFHAGELKPSPDGSIQVHLQIKNASGVVLPSAADPITLTAGVVTFVELVAGPAPGHPAKETTTAQE